VLPTVAVFAPLCSGICRPAYFQLALVPPVHLRDVWRELFGVRSQRSITRSLPRPRAASNCLATDGGSCIRRVDGARRHACALHHGHEHDAVTILAGSALVGFTVRRIAGLTAIERQKERINGFNILVLFVFVAAVMESVAARFLAAPMITVGLAALAFVVFFAVLCLTTLLFASAGRERALTLGFMASQRNVGLMLAATGGALPDLTRLYFAFSYFPIYLSPLLLQPLARRIIARAQTTLTPP
jgi:hypothetical protein